MPRKDCPNVVIHYKQMVTIFRLLSSLVFEGDKVQILTFNFSGDYQAKAHKYTEELFGRDNVFKAGTIGTIADKTAFGYVKSTPKLEIFKLVMVSLNI